MNVVAAVTISVYFVGLVNFSGEGSTREVVVPRAFAPVSRPPVTLEGHRPDIIINPLTKEDCRKLGGGMFVPIGKCPIFNVKGKHITLPAGTPSSLDASAHNIPKLKTLCSAVSGIKKEYLDDPTKYAVRLTLNSGKLDSCVDGSAWGSRLTLTDSDGKVTIEDKILKTKETVTLTEGTSIYLVNRPTSSPLTSGKEHFWWHYVIAEGATEFTGLPTVGPSGSVCHGAPAHDHWEPPAASGLGCSNSQYP